MGFLMYQTIFCLLLASAWVSAEATVIEHSKLRSYENNGNKLTGVATPSLGAIKSEVWHSSIAPGSETPPHTHATEELVILVKGTLEATVLDEGSSKCSAPCTIILEANKHHRLKNVGNEPTSHYLIMRPKSKIFDDAHQEMTLPWRQ